MSNTQALAAKDEGNVMFKQKKYDEAIQCYIKAISLDPRNMVYLNNKAAVYLAQKEYDKCITECERALEVGRQFGAAPADLAKALARSGKCFFEKEDEDKAISFLEASLAANKSSEFEKLLLQVKKSKKEKEERLAYFDPAKSLQEKTKGNELFQKGEYQNAIENYTEAIKRNPDDPKIYSNRAVCYTKLMEFDKALQDCDECLKKDPNFTKAYLRKATIYEEQKEVSKASQAFAKAMEIDPNCEEAKEGYRRCLVSDQNDPEVLRARALQDPEIKRIVDDPKMKQILKEMQEDPNKLREHLKDEDTSKKIEKLLEAGIKAIS